MNGLRAIRLTALNLWDELFVLLMLGALGSLATILVLPLPFVLAAHYGTAARLADERVISWREWLYEGRQHWPFFARWALFALAIGAVLWTNVLFYGGMETRGATVLRWAFASALMLWLSFQPYVAASYFEQADRRLRVALRNGIILALRDPLSMLLFWLVLSLLALLFALVAAPALLLLPLLAALLSTHIVHLQVLELSGPTRDQG